MRAGLPGKAVRDPTRRTPPTDREGDRMPAADDSLETPPRPDDHEEDREVVLADDLPGDPGDADDQPGRNPDGDDGEGEAA